MQIRLSAIVVALAWAVLCHPAPAWSDEHAPAEAIAAILDRGDAADADAATLRAFYAARNDAPAWSDPARAAALAAAVAGAADQGLDGGFPKKLAAPGGDSAARDVALTRLALAYATALAKGRAPLDQLETDWAIPAPAFDAASRLSAALDRDLAAWFAALPPQHRDYQRLVGALARYRKIASGGGWAGRDTGSSVRHNRRNLNFMDGLRGASIVAQGKEPSKESGATGVSPVTSGGRAGTPGAAPARANAKIVCGRRFPPPDRYRY